MEINADKSSFLYNNVDEPVRQQISNLLPYKMEPIAVGFKYLGYYLKPLGYGVKDWRWFLLKFKKKLSNWAYKLLSLGGRFVLIRAILTSLPVYWFALAPIPVSILNKMRQLIFSFLSGSSKNKFHFHLVD